LTVIRFSPATSVAYYQYHSNNSPYSCFIYLPSNLTNDSNVKQIN